MRLASPEERPAAAGGDVTGAPAQFTSGLGWTHVDVGAFAKFIGIGTILMDSLLLPFEVVKNRIQVVRHPAGLFSTGRSLYRAFGFAGLFRGWVPGVIGSLPSQVTHLLLYEYLKERLARTIPFEVRTPMQAHMVNAVVPFLSVAMTDVVSVALFVPGEVVMIRMQVSGMDADVGRFERARDVVRGIWSTAGVRGFFRGYGASLTLMMPTTGMWWSVYEVVKTLLVTTPYLNHLRRAVGLREADVRSFTDVHGEAEDPLVHSISGFAAGMLSSAAFLPLDVVKTRVQAYQTGGNPVPEHRNVWVSLRTTYRTEGVRALFKGFLPRVFSASLISALYSSGYEQVKRISKPAE
jgi:solute carrier family 25 protein 44